MRLKINLKNKKISIPKGYHYHLQSSIYKILPPDLASFLHDEGFNLNGRKYKLFVFSRLLPKSCTYKDGFLEIEGNIKWFISSPIEPFVDSIYKKLKVVEIGDKKLKVEDIEIQFPPIYSERVVVRTLSPITVFRTNEKKRYIGPDSPEFEELLLFNLSRKAKIIFGKEITGGKITPINLKEQKVIYKNAIITGFDGILEIELPQPLFYTAFETGLGANNSMGFGFIDIHKEVRV